MTNHINFRTATSHSTPEPAPRMPRIDPPRVPGDHDEPQRPQRRWVVPMVVGLAVTAAAVGLVLRTTGDDAPTVDTPAERGDLVFDTDAERPGDLSVSGWYTTRTYDEAPAAEAEVPQRDTDAERPGDPSVSGWYTTRTYDGPAIENTAAPVLRPVIIGESVVLPGTVSCIPFQALGPNADLAPDPSGQRSSGVEILAELRQRGPNADLPFDPTGQRSSGLDPVCAPR